MDCPKCTGQLTPKGMGVAVDVHRCSDCAGIWCSTESLNLLQDVWMSDALLDIGDPRIGHTLDKIQTGICPHGHGRLEHQQDDAQKHIGYEICPTCRGIFLDAGEFTDLKHHTPMDRLKSLIARLKNLERN